MVGPPKQSYVCSELEIGNAIKFAIIHLVESALTGHLKNV